VKRERRENRRAMRTGEIEGRERDSYLNKSKTLDQTQSVGKIILQNTKHINPKTHLTTMAIQQVLSSKL
jgi:hypothetical protein